jgi:hypothetical protein
MCIGCELNNGVIDDYWNDLKIVNLFDRFDYMLEKYPILLVRGPLLEMAKMVEIQISTCNSNNRGLLHDSFHSIYCYYSDNLIAGDPHFKALRNAAISPVFDRIIMTEQLKEIWNKARQYL